MLGISRNKFIPLHEQTSEALQRVFRVPYRAVYRLFFGGFLIASFVLLFVPWRQNVQSTGEVVTRFPEQRPQQIQATVPGRIEKWFIKEGDTVRTGDTLVFLSEVKNDYFDPQLIERTKQQIQAKVQSIESYSQKVKAIDRQLSALEENIVLKREQGKLKVRQAIAKFQADSANYEAAKTDADVADQQLERVKGLFEKGLKSKQNVENFRVKAQSALSKEKEALSNMIQSQNEIINSQIFLGNIENDFNKEVAKVSSDKFSAMSSEFDAEEKLALLENKLANYLIRSGYNYIRAPQTGLVTSIASSGYGENLKEGQELCTIVPLGQELGVNMFVRPMDMPLMNIGEEVVFQFDGWPAIVFSGWPQISQGFFRGEIVAIDNNISPNGKYRVFVSAKKGEVWPGALRVGMGARGYALLNTVPVWYEIWRQVNGFPPDYYSGDKGVKKQEKRL